MFDTALLIGVWYLQVRLLDFYGLCPPKEVYRIQFLKQRMDSVTPLTACV